MMLLDRARGCDLVSSRLFEAAKLIQEAQIALPPDASLLDAWKLQRLIKLALRDARYFSFGEG